MPIELNGLSRISKLEFTSLEDRIDTALVLSVAVLTAIEQRVFHFTLLINKKLSTAQEVNTLTLGRIVQPQTAIGTSTFRLLALFIGALIYFGFVLLAVISGRWSTITSGFDWQLSGLAGVTTLFLL